MDCFKRQLYFDYLKKSIERSLDLPVFLKQQVSINDLKKRALQNLMNSPFFTACSDAKAYTVLTTGLPMGKFTVQKLSEIAGKSKISLPDPLTALKYMAELMLDDVVLEIIKTTNH